MGATLRSRTIALHGRLADAVGRQIEIVAPEHCSIAELRWAITAGHPGAGEAILSSRVRACVGDSIVPDGDRPGSGETIEFLPPVSGG